MGKISVEELPLSGQRTCLSQTHLSNNPPHGRTPLLENFAWLKTYRIYSSRKKRKKEKKEEETRKKSLIMVFTVQVYF